MTTPTFGVKLMECHGSFGEFSVSCGSLSVRAKYVLTKLKPGSDGTWENELASHMVPWREIFKAEELTFDELLQRDLNDSRVAHDLVPYLLDESGDVARFFPPVLAIIVPRRKNAPGVDAYYPKPEDAAGGTTEKFGDLFCFQQLRWDNALTPFATLSYNRQRSTFVIVDGQHRAMAVLALHRQLTDGWGSDPYASYYSHIQVSPAQVKSLELPVCLCYFPDLHEENHELADRGIDLKSVCRQIFLVVNRSAKPVSPARELLLDDDDFGARLMRRTLSNYKDRPATESGTMRIYSVAYGDSDESGKQVVHGKFQVTSAVALHKLHCAMSFGRSEAFRWDSPINIANMRNTRNPSRPTDLLVGSELDHLQSLSRRHGRVMSMSEVDKIVEALGTMNDAVLCGLFDELTPFRHHHREFSALRERLSDVHAKGNQVQQKCYSILFEGSGAREVFDEHVERLRSIQKEQAEQGLSQSESIADQLTYCESVEKTLAAIEVDFQRRRACSVLNIDYEQFGSEASHDDWAYIQEWSRAVYETLATQAFQIGFCMAVWSLAHELESGAVEYSSRLKTVRLCARMIVATFNSYFTPGAETLHKTLKGLVTEPHSRILDQDKPGIRGLIKLSVPELNERFWPEFRYLLLEILVSQRGTQPLKKVLSDAEPTDRQAFISSLSRIVTIIVTMREKHIRRAEESAIKDPEFLNNLQNKLAEAKGSGKRPEELEELRTETLEEARDTARKTAQTHLKATIGTLESSEEITRRIEATLA